MSNLPRPEGQAGEGTDRLEELSKHSKHEKAFNDSAASTDENKKKNTNEKFSQGSDKKNDRRQQFNAGPGNSRKHVGKHRTRKDGQSSPVADKVKIDGRADSTHSGGFKHNKNLEHKSGQSSHTNNSQANKNKGKSQVKAASAGIRGMRAPIQKTPEAEYQPRFDKPNHKSNKKKNKKQHSGHDHRSGQGKSNPPQTPIKQRELYAALDLGTNNCRLLVALPQERGRFRVVDGFSKIVRLGEGLLQNGRLSDDAMDRALEALKICSIKMAENQIKHHRLIATEACRQAENGQLFLDRVRSETGLKLEIIDRKTEAYLAAEGCGALMDRKADAAVLFDIGGGSSELILVNRRINSKRISDQVVSWTSVPIGVVTLAERYGGKFVDEKIFQQMIDEVKVHLENFPGHDRLSKIWKKGRVHLLGTSGTVTTLAGIHLDLPRYNRKQVDGLWLNAGDIDKVVSKLLKMDYQQRSESPCIGTDRADLVMAGCAILEAIRQIWPSERLRVADRGLREGILTQLMDRNGAWLSPKKNRWRKGRRNFHSKKENKGNHSNNAVKSS